ncbi:cell division protein FtsZ [Falsiporphyromonas endometrii]|uniref:Cell division protein FtsZ n=1 Tax=Falsiporphyromonas endometrii TaxID=1387297 RepID=A0ABV9K648_9PORP
MQDDEKLLNINYEETTSENPKLIKVIGVGGGGGNAVMNMHRVGINDVTFLLCNTDRQVLNKSNIAERIVIGEKLTGGLGAGNVPERGRDAALASEEEIRRTLNDGHTRMVFVTAGMGGGTGTGAAPVISKIAKDMGLLTIGIVTIPFLFEGRIKIIQALKGVEEIRKNVDALLVVNNERLCSIYQDLTLTNAFQLADQTLTNAATGISNMISIEGVINVDFADVKTTLEDGGVAIISSGEGVGANRLHMAFEEAIRSPLLNNNNVLQAKRILIYIYHSHEYELHMDEISAVNDFTSKIEAPYSSIWGHAFDDELGEKVKVTILASGYDFETTKESISGMTNNVVDPISSKEEERKNKHEENLISTYYNVPTIEMGMSKPVILSLAELDYDELIIELDRTPTYSRDMKNISDIRRRHQSKLQAKSDELRKVISEDNAISGSDNSKDDKKSEGTNSRTITF